MLVLKELTAVTDELRALVRASADQSESLRTMPAHLVEATKAAGLFRMAMPAELGGLELDPVSIVQAVEAMSHADASAGWTTLIGNSTAFFAWLDPTAAQDMLGGNSNVISTSMFAPMGRARRDGGNLIVDGRWPFNSGCVHADWYQTAVVVMNDGRPELRGDGRPDVRFAMFPRDAASIIDTWHSLGLRGTGSHDIEVHDLRVPIEQTAAPMLDDPAGNGSLARLGFFPLLTVLMSGFPLGVARRALDELAELAPTKRRGTSPVPIAEDPRIHYEIGRADAALQAARAFLLDALDHAWTTVTSGATLTDEHVTRHHARGSADDGRRGHRSRQRLRPRRRQRGLRGSPAPAMLPRHPYRQPAHRLRRPSLQHPRQSAARTLTAQDRATIWLSSPQVEQRGR
jgi:alkylation response protein AidB-like acyl-CoA dehydrogenase